jgi:cytochrome c553
MRWLALVAAIALGCAGRTGAGPGDLDDELGARHAYGGEPVRTSVPPERFARAQMVRYHMQRHFDDLRWIERSLVAGDLGTAKALAYMLTKPIEDPGLAPWAAESRATISAARSLQRADTIDEALRRDVAVAATCAGCHRAAKGWTVFGTMSPAPSDRPGTASQMARHRWAVDRLWEGMIGADDQRWTAALQLLATEPLLPTSTCEPFANRLQLRAKAALATSTNAERADAYANLLVTCSGCHRASGPRACNLAKL